MMRKLPFQLSPTRLLQQGSTADAHSEDFTEMLGICFQSSQLTRYYTAVLGGFLSFKVLTEKMFICVIAVFF